MSVSVVYWSGTGNTQSMAEAVAEGIREAKEQPNIVEVGSADVSALASEPAFALAIRISIAEQLEETEMEPFVEALEPLVSGKKILLFGSYGWGDGEWMRDWTKRMKMPAPCLSGKRESLPTRPLTMKRWRSAEGPEKNCQKTPKALTKTLPHAYDKIMENKNGRVNVIKNTGQREGDYEQNTLLGILIPFAGTTLGSAMVFFMKKEM